jgi:hypothetical protein
MDVVIHNNIDVHVGIFNFVHTHMISLENCFTMMVYETIIFLLI